MNRNCHIVIAIVFSRKYHGRIQFRYKNSLG